MQKVIVYSFTVLLCLMIAAVSLAVQTQKKTVVARVEGNIYEPVKVEPTDDRIKALKSNPRMIAVSDDGEDLSPALTWSGVPKEARSLVLMMEDPDAASPKPFVHWIVANIPPNTTGLPASVPVKEKIDNLNGAVQGANHRSTLGYYGPRPPAGEPLHHYHFQIFALDTTLKLNSGFNRQALLKAMKGHVLAKGEIVGTYQRQ